MRGLAVVFALTFVMAAVQWIVPATASGMQVALAIVLLTVPGWLMKGGVDAERRLGMAFGPWARELRVASVVMAIVFPLFALGYHGVQTALLDRQLDVRAEHLARWDEALELAPPDPCAVAATGAVAAWTQRASIWIVAPPDQDLRVAIDAEPPVLDGRAITCASPEASPTVGRAVRAGADGGFTLPEGQGLWVSLGDRDRFELSLRGSDDEAIPTARVSLGPYGASPDVDGRIEATRDAWWLLTFILVQLGIVALPEEWFFRGYVQGRVDQLSPPRWRLFGARVGWGVIIGALTFALLHPILMPGAHRLLVFFPALLFGWLRARTGHLGAAIVVHAGSNVLLAVISRMYV